MRSTTTKRLQDCALVHSGRVCIDVLMGSGRRLPAVGRVVDVAPHITCATFAVHQAVNEPGWCVSDTESGARASHSARSEADAISLATANLAMRTDDEMRRSREVLRQQVQAKAG